jgi:Ca-activated chloride channel family protein
VTFIWPLLLLLLLLIPVGVLASIALERRRRARLAAYGSLGIGLALQAPISRPRRAITSGLLIAGFTILVVALARPQAVVSLPRLEGTVILAFDVSNSMAAKDFTPTRMEAAKAAARAFVEKQPPSVQIGVVAFSDSGISVQAATNDQAQVLAAINRLTPQRGTSLAQGILASLKAIDTAEDPTKGYYTNRSPLPSPTPVPAGSHGSSVIVLLSDGENNEQPDPPQAAQLAADRGVRIHTVGIGTPGGTTLDINGFKVHTQLDAQALQQIAATTGGTYYGADTQAHLDAIYPNLDTALVVKPERLEVTPLFADAALVALLFGALSSILWMGRAP